MLRISLARESPSCLAELETLKMETLILPQMTERRQGSLVVSVIFHWGKVPLVCMTKNKNVLMVMGLANDKMIFVHLWGRGKVCVYFWGEKCRARETARQDESNMESHKMDRKTALLLESRIVRKSYTKLGKNLEKSPCQVFGLVTFSEIYRSSCLAFALALALALMSPVFELIILPGAVGQSYYGRCVSSTPLWNHRPSTSLA